jgi:hypothetical protein
MPRPVHLTVDRASGKKKSKGLVSSSRCLFEFIPTDIDLGDAAFEAACVMGGKKIILEQYETAPRLGCMVSLDPPPIPANSRQRQWVRDLNYSCTRP